MAIRNNTTSLSMGMPRLSGRSFSDPIARNISNMSARDNLKQSMKSNYKVQKLAGYVRKMIKTWSNEDKMAVLAEYGDPRRGRSDDALVEALITNMKESDLEILLRDMMSDEIRLGKKVRDIKNMRKRQASRFNTRTFEEAYSVVRGSKSPKQMFKDLRKYDKSIKVPRRIRSRYGTLKKEIETVLKDLFDKVTMTRLALSMEVQFDDGTSEKELVNLIVNKTLLYVDLIAGKSKSYAGAFISPDPYNEILKYTSFSWVTGSDGMTNDGVTSLRKNAYMAKARMKLKFEDKAEGIDIGKRGIGGALSLGLSKLLRIPGGIVQGFGEFGAGKRDPMTGKRGFGVGDILNPLRSIPGLLGGLGGGLFGGLKWLTGQGGGMLSGAAEGAKSGSNIFGTIGDWLKGPNSLSERRLERDAAKVVDDSGKIDPDLKDMSKSELLDEAAKYGLKPTSNFAKLRREIMIKRTQKKIKLKRLEEKRVKLAAKGKNLSDKEKAEMQALGEDLAAEDRTSGSKLPYVRFKKAPMLVAGGGVNIQEVAAFAIPVWVVNQSGGGSGFDPLNPSYLEAIKSGGPSKMTPEEREEKEKKTIAKFKDSAMGLYSNDTGKKSKSIYGKPSGPFKGISEKDPFTLRVDQAEKAVNIKGARAIRVFDQSSIIMAQLQEKIDKRTRPALAQKEAIAPTAYSMGVKMVKKEPALPVYVVNKVVPTDTTKVMIGLAKVLTGIIDPTGISGELIGAKLERMAGATDGITQLLSMAGFATGGKGKGLPRYANGVKNSNVSHFIAGDSLNGKPNEERVSINWNKREFEVKPVTSMSQQDMSRSGISQGTKMSSAERSEPMKVFSVNPGISDLIDVNGSNVSLIGLVADMTTRLASIENLLSINNNQNSAIVTATTATAANVNKLKTSSGASKNPFANGFPSDLDSILAGS
jgi:hypothetical protein